MQSVRVFLLSVILLIALTACKPKQIDASPQLLLQTPELSLTLTPGRAPVETPLTLHLTSQLPLKAISAEIVGVTMFMGKIPLQWRQLDNTASPEVQRWQAEFLLGACSDPAMQWQLSVYLEDDSGQQQAHQLAFTSSWH